jgi:hypothetical protein
LWKRWICRFFAFFLSRERLLHAAPLCGGLLNYRTWRHLYIWAENEEPSCFLGQVYSISTASSQNKSSGGGRSRSGSSSLIARYIFLYFSTPSGTHRLFYFSFHTSFVYLSLVVASFASLHTCFFFFSKAPSLSCTWLATGNYCYPDYYRI